MTFVTKSWRADVIGAAQRPRDPFVSEAREIVAYAEEYAIEQGAHPLGHHAVHGVGTVVFARADAGDGSTRGRPPRPDRPFYSVPWTSTGVFDHSVRRLINALFRHRRVIEREFPFVAFRGPLDGPRIAWSRSGFAVGALSHLWGTTPMFRGRCPDCGGPAIGFSMGGMIEWFLHGVCRSCGLLVHRSFFRTSLHSEISEQLKTSPYPLPSSIMENESREAHYGLREALLRLGVTPLPDASYQFPGGAPWWIRSQQHPAN
jgi:hypothetical protein